MRIWTVALLCSLLTAGCTEEELAGIDRAVADVNAVAETVAALPESPAGPLIPPNVRVILELIGVGGAAAVVSWQKIRAGLLRTQNQTLQLTGKAIVAGVDRAPPSAATAVKAAISAEMDRLQIRDTGRATVEELKSG